MVNDVSRTGHRVGVDVWDVESCLLALLLRLINGRISRVYSMVCLFVKSRANIWIHYSSVSKRV